VLIYTIQNPDHWLSAQRLGYLSGGSGEHIYDPWKCAYEWMRAQMASRLPAFSGDFPVWAWGDFPAALSGYAEPGEEQVLLAAEVPEDRILVSDFIAWTIVILNDGGFDDSLNDDTWTQAQKEASWPMVFDFTQLQAREYITEPCPQLCVDRIFLEEIVAVRWFESPPSED
jgi:hypothetical protein